VASAAAVAAVAAAAAVKEEVAAVYIKEQTSMQAGRLQAVGRADQTSDEHGLGLATTAAAEAVRRHLEEERERERV
jgi:hypothetical protein